MNKRELYEILRLDPKKVAGHEKYWALYAVSFYEKLFAKMSDPEKIEIAFKRKAQQIFNNRNIAKHLRTEAIEALMFFKLLRLDELENPDFWEQTRKRKLGENMEAKLVKEQLNEYFPGGSKDPKTGYRAPIKRPTIHDEEDITLEDYIHIVDFMERMGVDRAKAIEIVSNNKDEIHQLMYDQATHRAVAQELKELVNESLNESMSRHCDFYLAKDGKWYMELASNEYGEWEDSTTYGPFNSEEAVEKYLDNNFSNPGGMGVDDSGEREVPTESPNGGKVVRPGGGGGRMMMGGYGRF